MDGLRWLDGFDAWRRLRGWHERGPGDGDAALDALSDIGVLRRLLDQAELIAVRTARGRSKTWAEIATRLGVTRQSAWERWRDLDDVPTPTPAARPGENVLDELVEEASREITRMRASEPVVTVPDVTGFGWETARRVLLSARLAAVSSDSDAPPPIIGMSDPVVLDQKPAAGERVRPGSTVTLWLGNGPGSAGVREPLHPHPSPRSTGGAVDEQTGKSVP
ncbi:MAG TPA: PASTA domain-containing protein [Actinophytocola sp.]|nr:PASTA domain-containing protein [Actinophytocola sp.]